MKRYGMVVLGVLLLASTGYAGEPETLKTDKEKASYTVGVDMARSLRTQGLDVDLDLVVRGMRAEMSGEKLLLSDEELKIVRNRTKNEAQRRQIEERQRLAKARKTTGEENRKAGEAFLAENRLKEGVVALPSGLQYRILKAGEGKTPTEAHTVEVHYKGSLVDGKVFENSYAKGKPATVRVKEVIPGWREALKLMPVGSKWQLFIPSELAYGKKGSGRLIGPNAALVFEVELLAIR